MSYRNYEEIKQVRAYITGKRKAPMIEFINKAYATLRPGPST